MGKSLENVIPIQTEVGHIVWHDLLTNDVARAQRFYAELLGWEYQIEHASDFVWQPGEADYPLILAHGEAHAGIVSMGADVLSHWVAYVIVDTVDAVVKKAMTLGGTIHRTPFTVPGVGRSAMFQDPQGAIICPYLPAHGYRPPRGTFLWDELITDQIESATTFYGELFGWQTYDTNSYTIFQCATGHNIAGAIKQQWSTSRPAAWVTYLAIDDIDAAIAQAKRLGAKIRMEQTMRSNVGHVALLTDPVGAVFGLLAPEKSGKL